MDTLEIVEPAITIHVTTDHPQINRTLLIDTKPRFLAVDLAQQLRPGTFEHALNHLFDHVIDLSSFDARSGVQPLDVTSVTLAFAALPAD